jgi:hypothetical protein
MAKQAVLLVNLGSPDSTSVPDVRRYLDEFLSDDRVLDKPEVDPAVRAEVLHPAQAPEGVGPCLLDDLEPEGSPLIVTSKQPAETRAGAQSDMPVALAMRYGTPSIPDVIGKLAADGVEELFLIPLYPHYAMSSYETVVVRVQEVVTRNRPEDAHDHSAAVLQRTGVHRRALSKRQDPISMRISITSCSATTAYPCGICARPTPRAPTAPSCSNCCTRAQPRAQATCYKCADTS